MTKLTTKQLNELLGDIKVYTTEKDYSIDDQNWFEDGLTSRVKNTEKNVSPRKLITRMKKIQKALENKEKGATYSNRYFYSSGWSFISEEDYNRILEVYLMEV